MSTLSTSSKPLLYSDLSGPCSVQGQECDITIYRRPDSEWVVEIETSERMQIVLSALFPSEESAYAAAMDAIRESVMDGWSA